MEKIASEKPSSNKGHDYQHVLRVIKYGEDFIQQYNKVYPDQAADIKDIWLFRIATLLHDFGRVDGEKNHSKRSAEFAQQFLEENTVINGDELDRIVKAIEHHSDGKALDDIVAVALYLGDKLDMTNKRVVADESDELSDVVKEMKKIRMVNYYIKTDENGDPAWVELRYEADYGFSLNRFKDYEKWIGVPLRVAREYLGIEDFRLFISGRPYIYHTVFNTIAAKDDHPVVM
jgi:HD superfamily phosphohydrolase YqeK